ncbi:adenosine deaminase [Plectosphaerella plurivora]|uniref:Adenosine deaminase n=1 Tax=Plectosphaerella plurivora TaxID=936078 RepID=A0A9P8VJ15_9PEZI|nr:adenosine deaminase [Plectosphaerella plurivora]
MDYKALPKIELHAHLTGSISRQTLRTIWAPKHAGGLLTLDDPALVMPEGKHDYDLKTFFPLFSSYIYALLADAPSLALATRSVLSDFAADGVAYLELRTTPRKILASDGSVLLTREEYVRTVLDAIDAWQREAPAPLAMHTRLILSVDRRDTPADAAETLRIALALRGRVVGLDLCGDPCARAPGDARGAVDIFTPVFQEAKAKGLKVTVHFAEAPVSGTDEELTTLLSWDPDRLGHVICLSPEIKEAVRTKGCNGGIGLELCLSCNVQAKMVTGGFPGHHLGEWMDTEGCHVSLGTDDVGVFGSPLSNEYRLAAEHFGLSDDQTRKLARGGIDSIFGGDEEKQRLREIMW